MAEESQETILHILIVALSLEAIAVGCTRSWLLDYSGPRERLLKQQEHPAYSTLFSSLWMKRLTT